LKMKCPAIWRTNAKLNHNNQMKTLQLQGRYGPSATLTEVSPKKWRYDAEHSRYGSDTTKLTYVDPPGGPMIALGSKLDIGTVVSIEADGDNTYIITK